MNTPVSRWFWHPLLVLLLGGCAAPSPVEVTNPPTPLAGSEARIPLKAALVLDEGLRNYVIRYINYRNALGEALEQYARSAVSQVFQTVDVFPDAEAARGKADVILIPRPVHSAQTWPEPYAGSNDRSVLLLLEWTAKDRENKRVFWLETVEGRASYPFSDGPFSFKSPANNERILFQKLFDALNRNTVSALRHSPEIRELAATPH